MKRVAWSYSALSAFETCPHRYHETKVAKRVIEPQTEATLWGNRVHKALEMRVGHDTPLPEDMQQYEPVAARIHASARDGGGKRLGVEAKMALNQHFLKTDWFSKDVWVRGIIDVSIESGDKLFIGDYKTGKKTPDSAQLRLTAAMSFAMKPWIKHITNTFIWLKEGGTTTEKFVKDDAAAIWQEFMPRVRRLEEAFDVNTFPKRPSGLCRAWCPVHTCEHNGQYKRRA